jgi:DNA-binding MarR family transcriptional regulator
MTPAKITTGAETLPDIVASKVMETTPMIMRFVRSKMRERPDSHTSVPQIRVMAFIESHPGCSLSPLSQHLGITSASASTMIERLVRGGLVERLIDPLKRRNVILHLTPPGQKELRGARQLAVEALSDQISQLDDTQLRHVEESMTLLKAIFGTVYRDLGALSSDAFTAPGTSSEETSTGQQKLKKRIRGTVEP